MPDWDSSERYDSDEDAAWRELVARFDSPLAAEEPVPWPEREDTGSGPPNAPGPPDGQQDEPGGEPADEGEKASPGRGGDGASAPPPSHIVIAVTPAARAVPPPGRPSPADDHYVPPPPPPLPKLDPVTKGAWVALFGGPAYLLVATGLNWTIPGVALFCAVAAFVAGVALLVFKLTDSDRDDPDDDGAVV